MKTVRIILSVCAVCASVVGSFATKTTNSLAAVYTKAATGSCRVSPTCTSGTGVACGKTAWSSLSLCNSNSPTTVQAHRP